jgi:hypothetical protein
VFLGPRVRGNGGAVQRAAQETRLAVANGQPAGVLWSMLRPEVPGNIAIYKTCVPSISCCISSLLSLTNTFFNNIVRGTRLLYI